MTDALVLTFEAPMMSFGGVAIDAEGITADHPGLALVTGLLANALGWRHGDFDRLQHLQDHLRIASRRDRTGERLVDYHTVDLGQDFLQEGFTTWGRPEQRAGGSGNRTHIRRRHYLVDAVTTVVVAVEDAAGTPTLDQLEAAVKRPARPLFLGRKTCLPSRPLWRGRVQARDLHHALCLVPRAPRADKGPLPAVWPDGEGPAGVLRRVHDTRDWRANVHAGARFVREGVVEPEVARA